MGNKVITITKIAHHYCQPYDKSIYTKNYMTAQKHMDLPHWHEPDNNEW